MDNDEAHASLGPFCKKPDGPIIPQAKIGDRRGKNNPITQFLSLDPKGGKKFDQIDLLYFTILVDVQTVQAFKPAKVLLPIFKTAADLPNPI